MVTAAMHTTANLLVPASVAAMLARVGVPLEMMRTHAHVVGGLPRDMLLGRTTFDIDLVVPGGAMQIARSVADALGATFVPLDEAHQVARVVFSEGERHWNLDFAAARGTIEQDLRARDFTVNAMAIAMDELGSGSPQVTVIDPVGGLADLDAKRLRAVSDGAFREDPARLLRAFRLAAELGFSMGHETETLLARDARLITSVARERIREELGRILETDLTAATIREMDRRGVLGRVFPELTQCKGVEQPKEHFWDVFDHSVETVGAVERLLVALRRGSDLLATLRFAPQVVEHVEESTGQGLSRGAALKLSALLHDVAKPQTKAIHENGRMRFLGHAQQGAAITDSILRRLRFSNRERETVCRMIAQHLRPGHLTNAPEAPTRRAIYRYFRDTADVAIDILLLSLADHLATRGEAFDEEGWLAHVGTTDYMLERWFADRDVVSPPKLIDGHVLMEKFGLAPGPEIGRLLESVREAQAAGEIATEQDALDFVIKKLGEDHGA